MSGVMAGRFPWNPVEVGGEPSWNGGTGKNFLNLKGRHHDWVSIFPKALYFLYFAPLDSRIYVHGFNVLFIVDYLLPCAVELEL